MSGVGELKGQNPQKTRMVGLTLSCVSLGQDNGAVYFGAVMGLPWCQSFIPNQIKGLQNTLLYTWKETKTTTTHTQNFNMTGH